MKRILEGTLTLFSKMVSSYFSPTNNILPRMKKLKKESIEASDLDLKFNIVRTI
jgi:hypothetical protein